MILVGHFTDIDDAMWWWGLLVPLPFPSIFLSPCHKLGDMDGYGG